MEENKVHFLSDIFSSTTIKILCKQFYCCFREKLRQIFESTIVAPCSFTINLYLNYYFPNDEQINEYLNTLIEK